MGFKQNAIRLLRSFILFIVCTTLGIIFSGDISMSWLLGLLIFYVDFFIVNKLEVKPNGE